MQQREATFWRVAAVVFGLVYAAAAANLLTAPKIPADVWIGLFAAVCSLVVPRLVFHLVRRELEHTAAVRRVLARKVQEGRS